MSEPITLGPFIGGLNTASDSAIVADEELVDIVNFELDLDGSLQSRPPIVETTSASGSTTLTVIGSAVIAGETYIFGSNTSGVYYKIADSEVSPWSLIVPSLHAKTLVQYVDNVYIPAVESSTASGGRWDGSSWTTDSSMPSGEVAFVYKNRVFIIPGVNATTNTSRLKFSDPVTAAALTWPALNFIDINPGDGQKLIDAVIYNDNIMLFKQDSTYIMAYDTTIDSSIVRVLNTEIGASGYRCVASYETSVFVYYEGNVYEIINYTFTRINRKVPFFYDASLPTGYWDREYPVFLSTFGDRLIVRYYNRIYVYGLLTRTWSRWDSQSDQLKNFGPMLPVPTSSVSDTNTKYFCGSCLHDNPKVFNLYDGYDSTTRENDDATGDLQILCTIETKRYSFNLPARYKKLMWWGIDIRAKNTVDASAYLVAYSPAITWGQLSGYTWNDIDSQLWESPLGVNPPVANSIAEIGSLERKFIKLDKTIRFRQIYFTVQLETDGTILDGPCRIYTLTAIVGGKQQVEARVN